MQIIISEFADKHPDQGYVISLLVVASFVGLAATIVWALFND